MRCATILVAALIVILVAAARLEAGHLAAVHPLVAFANHSHKDHSEHDLSGVAKNFINLGFAGLSRAGTVGAHIRIVCRHRISCLMAGSKKLDSRLLHLTCTRRCRITSISSWTAA